MVSPISSQSSTTPLAQEALSNSPDSINSEDSNENPVQRNELENASANSTSSITQSSLAAAAAEKHLIRRRKHKNSKLGCPNCKKRRVKCTENLPACSNCIKHKVKCGYLDYTEEQLNELRQAKLAQDFDELTTSNVKKSKPKTKSLSAPNKATTVVVPKKAASFATPSIPHSGTGSGAGSINAPESVVTGTGFEGNEFDNDDSNNNNVNNFNNVGVNINNMNNINNNINGNNSSFLRDGYADNMMMVDPTAVDFSNSASSFTMSENSIDFSNPAALNPDSYVAFSNVSTIPPSRVTPAPYASALPNAIRSNTTFTVINGEQIDYQEKLLEVVGILGPSIDNGTCPLPQIRHLYYVWLNSFIYRSYTSEMMFSCLINLTTNYLITNCFINSDSYKKHLPPQGSSTTSSELPWDESHQSQFGDKLSHYARVIKDMRYFLNKNEDPDLCSSVSYILSLMSIYDPEATLNSSNCFRDGLFSILSYNINLTLKRKGDIGIIITTHLKLMKNIARSVYLPGYDPALLIEFQSVLNNFSELIRPVINRVKNYVLSNNLAPVEKLRFVEEKLVDLIDFTDDCINKYIPAIYDNFSDIDKQQELLFDMIYRWVRFFPSRLTVITPASDPLEKVLYLFYKVLKKSLYAIFPQVKFFFLRDFDSPLMLDVFVVIKDVDIFFEYLEHPKTNVLPWELYGQILPELKNMSSYLIRLVTFLQIRVGLLYRYVVYEQVAKEKFPIKDSRAWRDSITDIEGTRQEFNKVIGLKEVPIKSFLKTYIKVENYPRLLQNGEDPSTQGHECIEAEVDFSTLQQSGLLRDDFNIMAAMMKGS
ncbi:Zn_clus Fungal Zn(2)-Cys(6) binuclear cluster domain [Scheffersomyces stipitis CBS 6054]|uniref:Zn_clus Fungal Zn(2)-Cys(6) binuclear cluster domain n=1 Tax=Scheffersomyces stipitis (strain ATCC 58785 / CBS 6054 / NBRC 10063 / NRRL Y-11545) TaxID=322104 RepID=A3LXX2_PICST|nr:Zn_clus Fungal Zn(2)-Cys(6) binuclear cluster domain [Scheffersomyces stipitis CBS 6054]ABN67537.2 Zn_clus Fungal Zn(2)-Cys(6) binuclear cluster domain [Scheffersomyces stipitis CBS 6054]